MHKPIQLMFTVLLTVSATLSAQADELLSPALYANELQRCVAQIRLQTAAGDEQALRHMLTRVSKDGAWYSFTIDTFTVTDSGTEMRSSGECRASRYNQSTDITLTDLAAAGSSDPHLARN